jgi:hypothetical protein
MVAMTCGQARRPDVISVRPASRGISEDGADLDAYRAPASARSE